MNSIKCDFCGAEGYLFKSFYDEVYQPIGTKRNSRVCVCNSCGLVFSIHDDIPYSREPNPSGDADWGNVRFCKGQRFAAVKDILPKGAKRVLDVGSSRGDFVKWYREQNPKAEIVAIEPDTRVIGDYADEFEVIGGKLENNTVFTPSNHYDFVYCMQTLEHTDSASAMLKQIYDCLEPGGVLFLEVPNIEVIRYPLNIEEFFIDKHNFHFSHKVLKSYLEWIGFKLEKINDDDLNVRIFASKSGIRFDTMTNEPASYSSFPDFCNSPIKYYYNIVDEYAETIQRNRAKLPAVVEKINRILDVQKVAFWGANTMLDLMVKYGGLDPSRVECLVDTYMAGNLDAIHGVPIQSPDALRGYQPDVCIVLARHSAEQIAKLARKYGIRNVIKFSDLLEE